MFEAGLSTPDEDAIVSSDGTELLDTIEISPDDLLGPACTPGDDGDATMRARTASGTVNRAATPNGLWWGGRREVSSAKLFRG
jgi:hypothetical protein